MASYGSLVWVGQALGPLTAGLTEDLIRATEELISVRDLAFDLAEMRAASIAENVSLVQYVLANNIDPATVAPPAAAAAYAQRLARRGVPLTALLRAYGIGQYRLLDAAIGVILAVPAREQATRVAELLAFAGTYLDRLNSSMGRIYETERDRWLSSRQAARQQWIARLLDGDGEIDATTAETALGYRLDQRHLAAELWAAPATPGPDAVRALEQAREMLSTRLGAGGTELASATGARDLRLWLPVGGPVGISAIAATIAEAELPVRVALGPPGDGVPGFRYSARGAARAKALAVSAGPGAPPVVDFDAVAPFALLVDDTGELTGVVERILGPLARDTTKMALLRHTLDVFLAESRSYSRTARVLDVHRNTVQYRIQQVTGRYGIAVDTDTFDIRFALGVCRWHPQVLTRTF